MLLILPAPAQSNDYSFKIELQGQDPLQLADYSIQLFDAGAHAIVATAFGDTVGAFSFRGVPSGNYVARVIDGSGYLVREELVTLDGLSPTVQLRAPSEPERTPPGGGSVSVRQLLHRPSKAAIKAFTESQKYSEAGHYQDAASALERAIRLSPDFAEAHTNLAAQYLRLGQFEQSRDQSKLGMEIAGPNMHDLTNLATAEWALGRAADALGYAQAAIRLDQRAMGAHYIAGSLLILNPDTIREGIHHLEIAAEKFPTAARKLATCRQAVAQMR